MSTYRFSKGQQFVWNEIMYVVLQRRGDKVTVEDATSLVRTVEYADLVQALFSEQLRFVVEGEQSGRSGDAVLKTKSSLKHWDLYPPHSQAVARFRMEVIWPLLQIPLGERKREHVKARVEEIRSEVRSSQDGTTKCDLHNSVSVSSTYQWMRDLARSGGDVRALIPATNKRGGKGRSRLAQEVEKIIETEIDEKYMAREKVTIEDIFHAVVLRIAERNQFRPKNQHLDVPSLRTIARRINALEPITVFAAKHGTEAAQREFAQYSQIEHPVAPLERVEIDHTRLDVIVVDPVDRLPLGRPTLTIAIDVATRYPLGYYLGFEPPSYYAVMECLYHCIRPKENTAEKYGTEHLWIAHGIFTTLVIDNAKEFIGRDLDDACLLLGINLLRTPFHSPNYKPIVERLFRTLNTLLIHKIPGTTFSNLSERGDYDSTQEAVLTLDELERYLNIGIIDLYAERFHRSLKGTPARRWEAATQSGFSPRLPANMEELSILLGRIEQRTVQHYGIEFENLLYNSDDLSMLRGLLAKGEHVTIKYHPGDISYIYVQDPFRNCYIKVQTGAQEYVQGGMSLWKHKLLCDQAREECGNVSQESLARAKRKMESIIREASRNKRKATRSEKARWEGGRTTSEAQDVTNIYQDTDAPNVPADAKPDTEEQHTESHHVVEEQREITFDLP